MERWINGKIDRCKDIEIERQINIYIKHMLSLNQSQLEEASSEDTLMLSFLGNYLKDAFENPHPEGNNV